MAYTCACESPSVTTRPGVIPTCRCLRPAWDAWCRNREPPFDALHGIMATQGMERRFTPHIPTAIQSAHTGPPTSWYTPTQPRPAAPPCTMHVAVASRHLLASCMWLSRQVVMGHIRAPYGRDLQNCSVAIGYVRFSFRELSRVSTRRTAIHRAAASVYAHRAEPCCSGMRSRYAQQVYIPCWQQSCHTTYCIQ